MADPFVDDDADDQDLAFPRVRPAATRRGRRQAGSSKKVLAIVFGGLLHLGAVGILVWIIFGRGGKPAPDAAPPEAVAKDPRPVVAHRQPTPPDPAAQPRPADPTPAAPQWALPPVLPPAGLQPLVIEAVPPAPPGGPLPAKLAPVVRDFEPPHEGPVRALAVLSGGKQLLTAGADGRVRLWDTATAREVKAFDGPPQPARALAVNAAGTVAASGCDDGSVRVWDVALAKEAFALTGHAGPVRGVAFSPNGLYVLSGGEDGTVRLWDLNLREKVRDLKYGQPVTCVAFGTDGRRALVGGDNGTVAVYDLEAAQPLHKLTGHIGTVTAVAFSPDGHTAVSVGEDKTLRFWDVVTGQRVTIPGRTGKGAFTHMRFDRPLRAVAFAGDGSWVVAAGEAAVTALTLNGRGRASVAAPARGAALALGVAPDGSAVFLGTDQGAVRRLDLQGGTDVVATSDAPDPATPSATPPPSPPTPAPNRPASLMPKWTANAGPGTVRSLAVAANGRFVTGGSDKAVRVWDPDGPKEVASFAGYTSLHCNVAISRDGATILTGGNPPTPVGRVTARADHLLRAVAVPSGKATNVGILAATIDCLALSPNGRYAVTGCEQAVHYWDVAAARQVRFYVGHGGVIKAVDFHPRQPKAASVATDGTVRIWDLNSTRLDRTITGVPGSPRGVAFSPVGRSLLVYGHGVLGAWDAVTGKPLQQFTAPTRRGGGGSPSAACWSPDGNVVVATLGSVSLLDAATGAELRHFDGASGLIDTVGVSGDGRYVVAAGRSIWVWELDKPLAPAAP